MDLFSKEFVDSLPELKRYINPQVVFLLKSRAPSMDILRSQVNKWFDNIPEAHQKDLLQRLHSLDDKQHLPAFYELMWHQFLLEEGHKVEIHPQLLKTDKHPDFFVEPDLWSDFYFEVATVFENKERRDDERRLHELLQILDDIRHYFCISVNLKQPLPPDFSKNKYGRNIKDFLTKEMDRLDRQRDGRGTWIELPYENGEIRIDFSAVAWKKLHKRPIVGTWSGGVYSGNARPQIQKALKKKINKYKDIKELQKPLIIAICGSGHVTVDDHSLDNALFGNHMVIWTTGTADPNTTWTRDQTGMVTPNKTFAAQNTRLSAALFCSRQINKTRTEYRMKLFHNPWAANPISEDIFSKIPQLIVIEKDENSVKMGLNMDDTNRVIVFE